MGEVSVGVGPEEVEMKGIETAGGEPREIPVKWEKFLPRMLLRVLLVEADDSTRKIVSALLRKCGYRVSEASDGLEAWETLKEKPNNVDIILSEVELPNVSGYALLSTIMEHDTCKSIPVIMMSSHDSMSMVFKCMLKGAADFLVKPIRKNELRNLWQHVWRRELSNSHPGGTNGQQKAENIDPEKSEANYEYNSASNHSSDLVCSTRKNVEGSKKGSDTQSSCTRPDTEAETSGNHDENEINFVDSCEDHMTDQKEDDASDKAGEKLSDDVSESATQGKEDSGDRETRLKVEQSSLSGEADLIGSADHQLHNGNGYKRCRVFQAGAPCGQPLGVDHRRDFQAQLELPSLRKLEDVSSERREKEVNMLNHSHSSAFSRYCARSTPPCTLPPSTDHTMSEENADAGDRPAPNPDSGGGLITVFYEQSSGGGGSVVTSENGAPPANRSVQRQAALTKFRLKRKDRCFEKKVRYQSRQRLAEQRPRVKGQFVRQVKPCL